jgi:hypothetical protein
LLVADVDEQVLGNRRLAEPGSRPRVQAQLDHAAEPLAILVEERCPRPWSPPQSGPIASHGQDGIHDN